MNNDLPQAYHDDEIDLFELAEGLWARKWLIIGISAAATALGLLAALLMPPTFQADAQVRPPDLSSLTTINESGALSVSPEQAFQRGLNELESQRSRRATFEALAQRIATLPDADADRGWRKFAENISLTVPSAAKELSTKDYVTLSYTSGDAAFAAEVVNTLISTADARATETLLGEWRESLITRINLLQQDIDQAIELAEQGNRDRIAQLHEQDQLKRLEIQDQLTALRAKNAQLRQDRIARLEEALRIARSLDIEEPITLMQMGNRRSDGQASLAISADLNGSEEPLYLRGTRMLGAEIEALKARKSDDFTSVEVRNLEEQLARLARNREAEILAAREDNSAFVPGIEDMRAELQQLQGYLAQDLGNVHVMQLDEPADPPAKPIKPRKALIVAASLVAGGMLGILVALIANAAAQRRRNELTPA